MATEADGRTEDAKAAGVTRARRALQSLNFFMADLQAGIGPFLGVFLQQSGWATGPIGTMMTAGGVAGMISPRRRGRSSTTPQGSG